MIIIKIYATNVACSGNRAELPPTNAVNVPAAGRQPPCAGEKHERSFSVIGIVTVALAPAARATFLKPLSCRGGSPAAAGNCKYSCATSAPLRFPVFVSVKLTECLVAFRPEYENLANESPWPKANSGGCVLPAAVACQR